MSEGPCLNILVADDNPVNQRLAVRILGKAGHTVTVANNGQEALTAVGASAFDLVLMDVEMPIMGGLEATTLIRQREQATGQHVPVVAMTAHAIQGDREKCLAVGMDGYLSKPLRNSDLFAAIVAATNDSPIELGSQAPSMSHAASGDMTSDVAHDENGELRRELAAMFLEDCPKSLSQIRAALTDRDGPAMKLAAHTLKGSAGVFKDDASLKAALRMEQAGQDVNWEQAEVDWEVVQREMARLSAMLSGEVACRVDPSCLGTGIPHKVESPIENERTEL